MNTQFAARNKLYLCTSKQLQKVLEMRAAPANINHSSLHCTVQLDQGVRQQSQFPVALHIRPRLLYVFDQVRAEYRSADDGGPEPLLPCCTRSLRLPKGENRTPTLHTITTP